MPALPAANGHRRAHVIPLRTLEPVFPGASRAGASRALQVWLSELSLPFCAPCIRSSILCVFPDSLRCAMLPASCATLSCIRVPHAPPESAIRVPSRARAGDREPADQWAHGAYSAIVVFPGERFAFNTYLLSLSDGRNSFPGPRVILLSRLPLLLTSRRPSTPSHDKAPDEPRPSVYAAYPNGGRSSAGPRMFAHSLARYRPCAMLSSLPSIIGAFYPSKCPRGPLVPRVRQFDYIPSHDIKSPGERSYRDHPCARPLPSLTVDSATVRTLL